jgi:DNA-binding beta-propeller fold protein YncE
MRLPLSRAAMLAGLAFALTAAPARASDPLPLRTVARVPLPGQAVRFDYQSYDARSKRLWIAHMNADELLAFDVVRRRVVKRIPARGVHGVIAVPELGRVYASATNDRQALTIAASTGRVLARAPAGDYPDGLAYDPVERHVFVSDESGGVETVLDASGRRLTTIRLGGEAGNVQYDAGSHRILVDVQSLGQVAVIDPRTNRIVRRVPLDGCAQNHSLLVDSPRRLAFVGCEGNARLLTLDLRTMRVTGAFKVGDAPDVLALDPTLRRLYVSAESGVVGVFRERARTVEPLGAGFLAEAAHSVAVDPATHLVYFPLERGMKGGAELLIMAPRAAKGG